MNTGPAGRLEELSRDYWELICYETPMTAILAGESPDDPQLFRESPEDHDRRAAAASTLLKQLSAISLDGLAAADTVTHTLLTRELENLVESHRLCAHLRPSLFPAGPEFNLVFFANSATLTTESDAQRYLQRLRTVPGLFAQLRESLEAGLAKGFRYPGYVVRRAAEAAQANLCERARDSQLFGPFERGSAAHSPVIQAIGEKAATLIEREIMPALASHVDYVRDRLGANSRDTIACNEDVDGEDYYDYLVRNFTSLEVNADSIHALGLEEVARLEAELKAVAEDAGYGNRLSEYRDYLSSAPAFFATSLEEHLLALRSLCKRIDAAIPAYFGRLPRITYGVEPIPSALAGTLPPAYAQPGPADHSSPGIFWVTSLLDKCPRYMYPSLALHEAWPGHLMQIALMQEQGQLPAFRRNGALKYTACIEGWAMYCEQLGEEMGLYDTPHERFGRLNMEMWRAVRLAVDTGMHTLGWDRDKAVAFMSRYVSITPSMIDAEVDRYMALPGQALAYQPGNLKFRELRDRAQSRLGTAFNYRGFHDALIALGPVTLPILDAQCDLWIAHQQVGAVA